MPANNKIDAYIANYNGETNLRLRQVRRAIEAALPDAEQTISYGMPTYKIAGKNAMHFAAFAHHISIFPSPAAIEQFADALVSYKTSKGTIQFQNSEPLTLELITAIAEWRKASMQQA